jgi:CheY-like chemotaxis protein
MDLLLIEDHPDTAKVFAQVLLRQGHHVEVAGSCAEAAKIFRQNYFDVVLCDIGLPDGDGCDLIRDLLRVRKVKAIAISGYAMREDKQRCKDAGFVAHLTKPVELNAIFKVLEDVECGAYEFPFFDDEDFDLDGATS